MKTRYSIIAILAASLFCAYACEDDNNKPNNCVSKCDVADGKQLALNCRADGRIDTTVCEGKCVLNQALSLAVCQNCTANKCEDGKLRVCENGNFKPAVECKDGKVCVDATDAKPAHCGAASCTQDTCADDGKIVVCKNGVPQTAAPCPAEGHKCVTGADGKAECKGQQSNTCLAECEGDKIKMCKDDGTHDVAKDCANEGEKCRPPKENDEDKNAKCKPSQITEKTRCEGDFLLVAEKTENGKTTTTVKRCNETANEKCKVENDMAKCVCFDACKDNKNLSVCGADEATACGDKTCGLGEQGFACLADEEFKPKCYHNGSKWVAQNNKDSVALCQNEDAAFCKINADTNAAECTDKPGTVACIDNTPVHDGILGEPCRNGAFCVADAAQKTAVCIVLPKMGEPCIDACEDNDDKAVISCHETDKICAHVTPKCEGGNTDNCVPEADFNGVECPAGFALIGSESSENKKTCKKVCETDDNCSFEGYEGQYACIITAEGENPSKYCSKKTP